MREKIAKEERDIKELEGCTFAPVMMTKKKKVKEAQPSQDGYDDEEPNEPVQRDIYQFLEDQKKFDEEKKLKQLRLQ